MARTRKGLCPAVGVYIGSLTRHTDTHTRTQAHTHARTQAPRTHARTTHVRTQHPIVIASGAKNSIIFASSAQCWRHQKVILLLSLLE